MKLEQQHSEKPILVLGATGAMATYLVPELLSMGYTIKAVSLDHVISKNPRLTSIQGNTKDKAFMQSLLSEKYSAIVDFMIYGTAEEFQKVYASLLQSTDHYIFFSSYRIYAGNYPITETSPRLLEASDNKEYLAREDEYSLYKAREEDILQKSSYSNWTIVRPSITFSKRRFQLVTLEAPDFIERAKAGQPVFIPEAARTVQGTMTWAGDTAKMLAGLLFNPLAYRECFTLGTAEHHTWGEIAGYYQELIGLKPVFISTEDYLKILGSDKRTRYQLDYDRLFNRIIDNSKILRVTGLKQENFISLRDGLQKELSALPNEKIWQDSQRSRNMDQYLKDHPQIH